MEQQPFQHGDIVIAISDCSPTYRHPYKRGDIFTVDEVREPNIMTDEWGLTFLERPSYVIHCANNFRKINEQYSDLTREIAEGLKETKETPDKILIPQTVNN